MPTFSYPTSASASASAPTSASAVTVVKPVRGAAKKKNAKVPSEEVKAIKETIIESEDYVETSAKESSILPNVVEQEPEPEEQEEPEPEPEPEEHEPDESEPQQEEYVRREPTFPDVVILKQTDKNYIVKHNHYAIPVKTSANIHEISMVGSGADADEANSADGGVVGRTVLVSTTDLVSPNQIYKGQINKKRGRKPKAGIILNSNTGMYDASEVPNIILHLKCHLSDLKLNDSISNFDYTPSISEVESYNLSSNLLKSCEITHSYNSDTNDNDDDNLVPNEMNTLTKPTTATSGSGIGAAATHMSITASTSSAASTATTGMTTTLSASSSTATKKHATEAAIHVINERQQKEIMKKINRLKYSFHNGETIQMKLNHKSACFWDTCEFDGPIYYIPIMVVNGVFHVSGCFCSPECALASLLKEQMDTSTKFERIHLLHLLYGNSKSTGFKPAPNPNYLLDKYYGNLTIDEFRSLFKSPQMIHVVNKPLTHILPELYEDNNDFLVNSKVIPTNTLKLKKRYKTTFVQHSSTAD